MEILNTIPWETVSFYAVMAYCLFTFVLLMRCYKRLRKQKGHLHGHRRRIHELEDDVRALYDSGTTLGNKLQALEKSYRVLKEQQEKLSLKEPDQQTYRNAIQAIHNGEAINQVAESSGLSRGEVELLTLFQKANSKDDHKAQSAAPQKAKAEQETVPS